MSRPFSDSVGEARSLARNGTDVFPEAGWKVRVIPYGIYETNEIIYDCFVEKRLE